MGAANEKQWREFWQRLGVDGNPGPVWQALHAAYTESWRAYHSLEHIGHCLTELAVVRELADDATAIEAAIWFHDVIYDTHRKDNEERSAEFAVAVLRDAGKSASLRESVRNLILSTRHQSQPASKDARLLTDIDLSILGQSPERYAEFEQQIRREYAWVGDKDFVAGRSAILNSFLQRESIYNSPAFTQRYEKQARVNLTWAIKQLDGSTQLDVADILKKHSKMPFERLRVARHLSELKISTIQRGVVFIFAVWSGPAIIAFERFTRVLAGIDTTGLDLVVLDTDCLASEAGVELWGKNVGGGGETLWIRDGVIVARLALYVTDSESELIRNTQSLLL